LFTNGTRPTTRSGSISSQSGSPQEAADDIRRRSSSSLCSVRATSMPPLIVSTPSSSYWRALSRVSAVISFEWSTGKMKFEAWPVEPPGFGSGPLSTRTMSFQPSFASW
jgi:hypothetical protein